MKKRADGRWAKTITINKKKIFFYSTAATEKQAERDIQRQMIEYSEKEEKGRTLLDVSEEWFDKHSKKLEYSTAYRYGRYKNQLNEYFPDAYIRDITINDIEEILEDMVEKEYSAKTIKDFTSVIRMIFKYAKKENCISENIGLYIQPPSGGKASVPREALTEEQTINVSKMLNCTFGLLAFFYLCTGLRKSEALALQWKDIDFDNRQIYVYKKLYHESNKPYIKNVTKTKAGTRIVILLDCLAEQLRPLKGKPEEYVFNKNGNLIDKSYYTRQWEKYKKESGIYTTAHPLRHTYATIVFESGISEKDAQMLMGHSSIVVTHNIYTHIRATRMQDTADKLNNYVSQSLEKPSEES